MVKLRKKILSNLKIRTIFFALLFLFSFSMLGAGVGIAINSRSGKVKADGDVVNVYYTYTNAQDQEVVVDTNYTSLDTAINAINNLDDTFVRITLLANTTSSVALTKATNTITIVGGSYTLSSLTNNKSILILNGGTITNYKGLYSESALNVLNGTVGKAEISNGKVNGIKGTISTIEAEGSNAKITLGGTVLVGTIQLSDHAKINVASNLTKATLSTVPVTVNVDSGSDYTSSNPLISYDTATLYTNNFSKFTINATGYTVQTQTIGGVTSQYLSASTNTYTVTFNGNGGTIGGASSTQRTVTRNETYGDAAGGFPSATLSGAEFVGWYTDVFFGSQITSGTVVTDNPALQLYARYREKVIVTYNDLDYKFPFLSSAINYINDQLGNSYPILITMVASDTSGTAVTLEKTANITSTAEASVTGTITVDGAMLNINGEDLTLSDIIATDSSQITLVDGSVESITLNGSTTGSIFNGYSGSVETVVATTALCSIHIAGAISVDEFDLRNTAKIYVDGDLSTLTTTKRINVKLDNVSTYDVNHPIVIISNYVSSANLTLINDITSSGTGFKLYETDATGYEIITMNRKIYMEIQTYTLTADANGGTIPATSDWTVASGSATATKTVTYGSQYGTLPTPTIPGYDFDHWDLLPEGYTRVEYIASSGGQNGQYIDTGYEINSSTISTFKIVIDQTITKTNNVWSVSGLGSGYPNLYVGVRLNGNFGYGSGSSDIDTGIAYTNNTRLTYCLDMVNARYTVSGSQSVDISVSTAISGNNWRNYTLFGYKQPSGTVSPHTTKIYSCQMYNGSILVRNYIPCKYGNTAGLYDTVGGQFYTTPTGSFTAGSEISSSITDQSYCSIAGDHTLYARWTANQYTVTYDANGGSVTPASTTVTYGSQYGTLATPTRNGYTFNGWYTSVLPEGYTEVEYIASSGTQYIDTGYEINSSTISTFKIVIDQTITKTDNVWSVSGLGSGYPNFYVGVRSNGNFGCGAGNNDNIDTGIAYTNNTRLTYCLDMVNARYTVSGSQSVDRSVSTAISGNNWRNYTLFGYKQPSGTVSPHTTKIYSCQMYNGSILVRNYIPCKYGNTAGLYDTVGGQFYTTPTGTGSFTAGPECEHRVTDTSICCVSGAHTLTAHWTANTYTITYNSNYGTATTSTQDVTYAASFTTKANNTFTRAGYSLVGWSESSSTSPTATKASANADFTGTQFLNVNTAYVYKVTGNKTLYAIWQAEPYTITYDADGGDAIASKSYTIESTDTLPSTTKEGYTFGGWKPTSTVGSWDSSTIYESGTSLTGKYGTVTLKAQWTIDSYTVTLVKGTGISDITASGTGVSNRQVDGNNITYTVEYNSSVTITATPSAGYQNPAWTTSDVTITNNAFSMPAKDVSITANASLITYSITYNKNGGDWSSSAAPATYNVTTSTITLSSYPIAKTGYTFGGWYDNEDFTGSAITQIAKGSTGDVELWANWTIDSHKLTIDPNGGSWGGTTNNSEFTQDYNTQKSIEDPTRVGYRFDGWDLTDSGTWNSSTKKYTFGAGDGTLTAQWTIQSYTLTLVKGTGMYDITAEGTGVSNRQVSGSNITYTVEYNSSVTITPDPDDGYENPTWSTSDVTITNNAFTMPAKAVTITANATAKTYTIIFNKNGGDWVSPYAPPTEFTVESLDIYLPNDTEISREGYTFAGWYFNSGLTGEQQTSIPTGSYGNKEYWAKWEADYYRIALTKNGGTFTISYNGTSSTAFTEIYGLYDSNKLYVDVSGTKYEITGITANYDGYTLTSFTGTGATIAVSPAKGASTLAYVLSDPYTSSGDGTLVATWAANYYKVSLNLNSGTSVTFTHSTDYTVSSNGTTNVWAKIGDTTLYYSTTTLNYVGDGSSPTAITKITGSRIGYTLANTTTIEQNAGITTITVASATLSNSYSKVGNPILTAGWQIDSHKLRVNYAGATVDTATSLTVSDGTTSKDIATTGTTYAEFTANYGSSVTITITKKTANLNYYINNANTPSEAIQNTYSTTWTVGTTDETWNMYVWQIYTIEYNGNGNTSGIVPSTIYKVHGTARAITANELTKTGYTPNGWVANSSTIKATPDYTISYTANANVTLYANWTANTYTITLNAGTGGSISSLSATGGLSVKTANSQLTGTYDSAGTFTATLTRTGYTFNGWADSAGNAISGLTNDTGLPKSTTTTSVSNLVSTANGSITLYAQWQINSYTITLTAGAGISKIVADGWTGTNTTITKTLDYGTVVNLSSVTKTYKNGYSGVEYTLTGAGSIIGNNFTVGADTSTIRFDATTLSAPTVSLTSSENLPLTYGTASTITASYSGTFDAGVSVYSYEWGDDASGSLSTYAHAATTNAGSYTYSCTITLHGDTNASGVALESSANNSLLVVVQQKTLTITAKPQTINYGDSIATGTSQVTVVGLTSFDELYSITLTPSALNIPSAVITPSAAVIVSKTDNSDVRTSNYDIHYETGTLTIYMGTITISSSYTGSESIAMGFVNITLSTRTWTFIMVHGQTYEISGLGFGTYSVQTFASINHTAKVNGSTSTSVTIDESHLSIGITVVVAKMTGASFGGGFYDSNASNTYVTSLASERIVEEVFEAKNDIQQVEIEKLDEQGKFDQYYFEEDIENQIDTVDTTNDQTVENENDSIIQVTKVEYNKKFEYIDFKNQYGYLKKS